LLPGKGIEAQSTPTEFAELSLQELFNHSIDEKRNVNNTKWTMGYHFSAVEYEGYLDGTTELSLDEVLWSGPSEPRTQINYFLVYQPQYSVATGQVVGVEALVRGNHPDPGSETHLNLSQLPRR